MSHEPAVIPGEMLFELVPLPVTDIDRAKAFYADQLGFEMDVDVTPVDGVRIVQFTPPGSYCSIKLSTGIPELSIPPGSLRGLHLIVSDIEATREALISRGVAVEPVKEVRGVYFAYFTDPDGNTWTLQHLPWRK